MTVYDYLKNESDDFLKDCFDELEEFRKDGILKQGKVRELNEKFFKSNVTTLFTISEMIYREIATRYYKTGNEEMK